MSLHDRITELIAPQLDEEEVAYGMFYAHTDLSILLQMLVGNILFFWQKQYVITVTSTRLFFTQINFFQRPIATTAYEYGKFEKFTQKKLLLAYKFEFVINKKK